MMSEVVLTKMRILYLFIDCFVLFVVDKTFLSAVICDVLDYSDMLMVNVYLPAISNISEILYDLGIVILKRLLDFMLGYL